MCYVLGHGIYNVTSSLVRGKFQSHGEIESTHEFEFYSEEVIYGMGIQTTND